MDFTQNLQNEDPDIFNAIKQEQKRQLEQIELIASENYVSKAVMEAQGSDLTNKYAEGYPNRRYYHGCENVDIVEIEKSDKVTTITQTTTAGTQSQSTFVTMDGYMNYNQIIKPDTELENHIAISLDANLLAGLLKSFKDKSNTS